MNFTFRIAPFYHGVKARFNTIQIADEEKTEASKFLQNDHVKAHSRYEEIMYRIRKMAERTSAEEYFFKHEGRESDLVRAWYLQRDNLRWYCIYWSREMVILGNGGIKNVAKTQDDEFLWGCESVMRYVSRCIEYANKNGDFFVDNEGIIEGRKHFDKHYLKEL